MIHSVLITGANSGLGKESARQFALREETRKVILGCRNPEKAEAAKAELVAQSGRDIFEILIVDVSDLKSVKQAVTKVTEPVDALIMNAGGMSGRDFDRVFENGVSKIVATNLLGHFQFAELLLQDAKINEVVMYAGSEAARGIKKMGIMRPEMQNSSIDEFKTIMNGSYFGKKPDAMSFYAHVKYMASLWMSSLSRKFPNIRIITVSPGGTNGTAGMEDLPPVMKFIFKSLGTKVMPLFGLMHDLETGAKRYVDTVTNPNFKTGLFYGSEEPVTTGPLVDQSSIFPILADQKVQDNAYEAIHSFLN